MQAREITCSVWGIEFETGERVHHLQYGGLRAGDVIQFRRFNADGKIYYTKEKVKRILSVNTI